MSLTMKSAETHDKTRDLTIVYDVEHQNEKTCLNLPVQLVVERHTRKVRAIAKVRTDGWDSSLEAFEQLATWLERLAQGIRKGTERSINVPVGAP